MTTLPAPARATHNLARSDLYLAALLACTALAVAAQVSAVRNNAGLLPAARWLALAPLVVAAYSRHGQRAVAALAVFFVSALLPASLAAWSTPAFTPLLVDILAYGVLLGVVGYLAATAASFLRTRQNLSGAMRDWEALLARTSELGEVAAFVIQQAGAVAPAQSTFLLLRNPVDGQWESLSLAGEGLTRVPLVEQRERWTLAHWLIEQNQPLILDNLPADRRFYAAPAGAGRVIHSLLAQPLYDQAGGLLAMIVLTNRLEGPFDQADFIALSALALAGQRAIEQAGQYARTDHVLARRVQQLAALQRTAHTLNTTMDPQAIIDETLACALSLSEAQVGLVSVDLPGLGPFHRTSNVAVPSETIYRATDLVRETRQALMIPPNDDSFYSLLPQPGLRLLAPIRRAGRDLGLILVESSQPLAFGQAALGAVASLADHAAVALDNTRLFDGIRREKRKSDEIIAGVTDALFTIEAEGRVTTFNPAAEALTGWRAEEAAGHLVCEVLGCQRDNSCQAACRLLQALPHGQRLHDAQWIIRQRLGTQRVVTLDASPLPAGDGQEGGLVVLLRDVTEAWEMERMQRELIAAFSHELRTPLTIINAATEMLLAGETGRSTAGDDEALLLTTLQSQTQRLTQFADRIVNLARSEEEAQEVDLLPLPLGLRLEEMAAQWRGVLGDRPLRLRRPPAEVWALADERALQAVMDVLLDNAVKYTPAGTPIELAMELAQPGYATVVVSDQGPGIAASHQTRLFDRFYRVDASDAQRVYGQGLGLYLARKLVAQMGGQIWVESEAGRGSCFAFTLPLSTEGYDEDFGDRR